MLARLESQLVELGQPIGIDIGALRDSESVALIEQGTTKIRRLIPGACRSGVPAQLSGFVALVENDAVLLWQGRSAAEIGARQLAVNSWSSLVRESNVPDYRPVTGIGICASQLEISIAIHDLEMTSFSTIEIKETSNWPQTLELQLAEKLCLLLSALVGNQDSTAVAGERSWSQVHPDARSLLNGYAQYQQLRQRPGEHDLPFERNVESQVPTHLICGAFQPLHEGHLAIAEMLESDPNNRVAFELAIVNADKPIMDHFEIQNRVQQNFGGRPLFLTTAGNFVDKSQLFPDTVFAVGVDTIIRVADPRFYGESTERRDRSIEEFRQNGCRFLVFGRTRQDHFLKLEDCRLPARLIDLCDGVPESEFRRDVSSTDLRSGDDDQSTNL